MQQILLQIKTRLLCIPLTICNGCLGGLLFQCSESVTMRLRFLGVISVNFNMCDFQPGVCIRI